MANRKADDTAHARILELLKTGTGTNRELSSALGIHYQRVRTVTGRMLQDGEIVEVGKVQGALGKPARVFGTPDAVSD